MHETIALLPALLFLATLLLIDSFKLVRPATVGAAVLYGALAASACAALHEWMLGAISISLPTFTRYVAPLTEEAAKALFIAFLLWRRRIGFLVDAAVLGFAVGTGFAIVENMLLPARPGPGAAARCGSCAASAPPSCTARRPRSSR